MDFFSCPNEGKAIKCCPKCGGTIVISHLYQYSYNQEVGKRGRIKKTRKREDVGSMEVAVAGCKNEMCIVQWDADEFQVIDDKFIDLKYSR